MSSVEVSCAKVSCAEVSARKWWRGNVARGTVGEPNFETFMYMSEIQDDILFINILVSQTIKKKKYANKLKNL
jgi:hypothetical protein